ncbi:MAG: thioredoxin family protein [Caldivirga sp.]|jgi:predicted thioredoxin/glutaredoxin|uniref:thioredoxin family protein n=1 Tax=Caldivirga sp. MU80 TaxID=1650354 RepID=UPI0007491264|nr:thioredoxin family protein [Caldivirga sp. MU80]KUO92882.1 MAG: glutaredoxin [Caldivirga sp. JCHS_4]
MDVEVFVHPTCSTCHTLIRLLKQWGYLQHVKVYDTSIDPHLALERGVRSVPSIFINGELVFAGIVDYGKLKEMLSAGLVNMGDGELSDEELVERFLRGVLDSIATALWLYINERCEAFASDERYLGAITNLTLFSRVNLARLVNILNNRDRCMSIIRGNEERFLRVIATNFAREVYWLSGKVTWSDVKDGYSIQSLAHWAMVRGSVSRVGLIPHSLSDPVFRGKIEKLWRYLSEHFDELIVKVSTEQEELKGDVDWVLRS